jgi:hypothetical protein
MQLRLEMHQTAAAEYNSGRHSLLWPCWLLSVRLMRLFSRLLYRYVNLTLQSSIKQEN